MESQSSSFSKDNSDSSSEDSGENLNKKLIKAAGTGDHEGVSSALEEGADITYKDKLGRTGLHIGTKKGH